MIKSRQNIQHRLLTLRISGGRMSFQKLSDRLTKWTRRGRRLEQENHAIFSMINYIVEKWRGKKFELESQCAALAGLGLTYIRELPPQFSTSEVLPSLLLASQVTPHSQARGSSAYLQSKDSQSRDTHLKPASPMDLVSSSQGYITKPCFKKHV